MTTPDPPPYSIEIHHVSETCLIGQADAAWWRTRLATEDLAPVVEDGRAEVMVCASDSRWGGRAFREGILTVAVETGTEGPGYFLVRGLDNIRFFAWAERVSNHAPYLYGAVDHHHDPTGAALHLAVPEGVLIDAHMGAREAAVPVPANFEGPIYLPTTEKGTGWFRAHLVREMAQFAFDPVRDTWVLGDPATDVFSLVLSESGFTPTTWRIGDEGTHEKSETVRRNVPPVPLGGTEAAGVRTK